MRKLLRKPNEKQKIIIEATNDYFGKMILGDKASATKIALWLMNRRKRIVLTEEEDGIKEAVKNNLPDYNPPLKIDSTGFLPQLTPISQR